MTYPLILAKIPVKRPWEVFAYLPFGNWNECPDTLELMAAAKYWFQQYGAVPAAITHDELEFDLPAPIPKEKAMEAAVEQYGLCPDMDQNFETLGTLADTLCQSNIWYFWCEEPAGVTAISDAYNTITVNVEANAAHPEYKYNILLDGVRVLQNVDTKPGDHIVFYGKLFLQNQNA